MTYWTITKKSQQFEHHAELAASELSWIHWKPPKLKPLTITSGTPCLKSAINSSPSLRRLMSWKPPPRRPPVKSCHKNTSTRRWQTSPSAWLATWWWLLMTVSSSICSNYVRRQVCILISSPTNRLLSEPQIDYQWREHSERWEMEGCLGRSCLILSFLDICQHRTWL